jgi:hypothetical protein
MLMKNLYKRFFDVAIMTRRKLAWTRNFIKEGMKPINDTISRVSESRVSEKSVVKKTAGAMLKEFPQLRHLFDNTPCIICGKRARAFGYLTRYDGLELGSLCIKCYNNALNRERKSKVE